MVSILLSFLLLTSDFCQTLYNEPKALAKSVYFIAKEPSKEAFSYRNANPIKIDPANMDSPVIVCLHGDKSYPATFIPLIDTLRKDLGEVPIFVPSMNYKEDSSDPNLRSDIEGVERLLTNLKTIYDKEGKPLKVIFIGHSMGGITATYYTYCHEKKEALADIEIVNIIGISSRLKSLNNSKEPSLTPLLTELETRMSNGLTTPYYSVFGEHDWLVPFEALAIASDDHTYIAPHTSHLGTLYDEEALHFTSLAIQKACN